MREPRCFSDLPCHGPVAISVACLIATICPAGTAEIAFYRMQSPGPASHDVEQASGLCHGRIAGRDGLWTVCDRNGGRSGGRIYRFKPTTLAKAKSGGTIIADEAITIAPPAGGWHAFSAAHRELGDPVLEHLRERLHAALEGGVGPLLDLEAITIGRSPRPPHELRLFAVAEEPYSLILELQLSEDSPQANLVAAYRYHERDDEHGVDHNDGLEGLAYAGAPGRFYWAEEGTRLHKPDAHPRLLFRDPRIGAADLRGTTAVVDTPLSDACTEAVRSLRQGSQQTLNAICPYGNGKLLAVDRNGGWILLVDPPRRTAERWINLYDLDGTNLRESLANFPGPRRMPYVSIEDIAVDDDHNIWLVDDPAMPEAFRASCLIRISGLKATASRASGEDHPGGRPDLDLPLPKR